MPLRADGGPIAVIGEFARTPRYQGAGSSQVNPTQLDSALEALREAYTGRREITFAPGFVIDSEDADPDLVAEAVAAAAAAEVVVLFLGLPRCTSRKATTARISICRRSRSPCCTPSPTPIPPSSSCCPTARSSTCRPGRIGPGAVLEAWLLGQAGGSATADLLTGSASPSGKLAETIPARYGDNPALGAFPGELGSVRYGEGLLIGYRWYDTRDLEVAYPFGHGLSYTSFELSELAVDTGDNAATVRLTVTNTGQRAGTETVQVYVTDP